jgi:hypothetical protein
MELRMPLGNDIDLTGKPKALVRQARKHRTPISLLRGVRLGSGGVRARAGGRLRTHCLRQYNDDGEDEPEPAGAHHLLLNTNSPHRLGFALIDSTPAQSLQRAERTGGDEAPDFPITAIRWIICGFAFEPKD